MATIEMAYGWARVIAYTDDTGVTWTGPTTVARTDTGVHCPTCGWLHANEASVEACLREKP